MELKEVTDYLGIEAEDLDSFKEKFSSEYFTEKQVFADKTKLALFTGKTLGSVTDNTLKIAKGFGVEFNKEDIKDKNIEDVINMSFESMVNTHEEIVKKAQSDSGKKGDEKYISLKSDYDKSMVKITDLETMNKSTADKLTQAEKDHNTNMIDFKRGYLKNDSFNKVNYMPDTDPLKKKGWVSTISEEFNFDYDEKGESIITDKEGHRIPNPKVHGTFKGIDEVLEERGIKDGMVSLNPQAGKPAPIQGAPPLPAAPANPNQIRTRTVNPKAIV